MRIILSYQSGVPIYEQIKEQIKASILSGELEEGELLPSLRQLARELKVSLITTTRVYNDLEAEHYVYSVPGKGCYVGKLDMESIREEYVKETREALQTAVKKGKMAGLTMENLHEILETMEDM